MLQIPTIFYNLGNFLLNLSNNNNNNIAQINIHTWSNGHYKYNEKEMYVFLSLKLIKKRLKFMYTYIELKIICKSKIVSL